MRTHFRVLIALAAALALLAGWWLATRSPQPPIGTDILFAASFPDSQGNPQPTAQWRGKVLVVNFWATWCPPCREEMPELSAMQEKYRAAGLVVIGIASDDVDKVREYARQNPATYPLLAGNFEAANLATTLGNNKSVLPYTVVVGRNGQVAATYFGLLDMVALEQDLQPLLDAPR